MKLFEMKDWQLQVSDEAWGLLPFNKILKRDKTKDKTIAIAEMLYIWYFCDIKSDYLIVPTKDRGLEIKKELAALPAKWKPDKVIQEGIDLYKKRSVTVVQKLYQQSLKSASDIGDYLENTDILLNERDMQGKIVTDIAKITASVQKVPKLMSDLKSAYKEVVKEQEDTENKKKGSKSFNTFEEGLNIDG